jgi:hypothetical protein
MTSEADLGPAAARKAEMDSPGASTDAAGARGWSVQLRFEEDEARTRVLVTLTVGSRTLPAHGIARRNPLDPNLPRVGEDLAVSRALSQLAHELLSDAVASLEATTHSPAGIRGA